MNNVTAAMAIEQFKKLPQFMKKRADIYKAYEEGLCHLEWLDLPLPIMDGCKTSYYFYHIQIKNGKRDELAHYLRAAGIYTTYRYFPLHRVPHYGISGCFPGADYAAENTLCLPIHQGLSQDDVQVVIETVKRFGNLYC